MNIQDQVQIVEDNLNEYGQCDITLEEFIYIKEQIRADAIAEFKDLGKLYSEIRADAIDEFVKAIEKHQTRQDSYLDPPYVEMGLDMTDVLEVAEQLKEQKNE